MMRTTDTNSDIEVSLLDVPASQVTTAMTSIDTPIVTSIITRPLNNGHYYNKETGRLTDVVLDRTGSIKDVYVHRTDNIRTDKVKLELDADEFRTCAKIVKHEGVTNNENEYICIAHTAYNHAQKRRLSLYRLLISSYSSVPRSEKTAQLSDTHNSGNACSARKGVISALTGQPDISDGAEFWDGTDLIAWGLNSPNGTPQNKFEEYYKMTIPKAIYDSWLAANLSKYTSGKVRYDETFYAIPAQVFKDPANWRTGDFVYETGYASPYQIVATQTFGHTIYWRRDS